MALKDMIGNAVNTTVGAAQNAMAAQAQGAQSQGAGGVMQGLMGNYSEMSPEQAQRQYGMYLMQGESISRCFSLLRDKMLFTDKRIIFVDHQGATGQKVVIETINFYSIVDVAIETSGAGFDHAELLLTYITTPYYKAMHIETATKKMEFPKGFDVQSLYRPLIQLAYNNVLRLNQ